MDENQTQDKSQEYLNNWKRAEADLANYRKGENERSKNAIDSGKEGIILEFLKVKDDLEQALKSTKPDKHQLNTGYRDGIEMTLKEFEDILERYGVRKIETQGKKFDPQFHEALRAVKDNGEPESVLEEVRAGYTMDNRVIRPARVIISQ